MMLQGERVTIRPMAKPDLKAMMAWRPFADPLYQPYDFPRRTWGDHVRWFEWRTRDPSRRMYVIENEKHQVIGSLTLREIEMQESARLGITIGADYVSQGYGKEALTLFFDYYFGSMGFERMFLDVAATNLRAVRLYRTLGFRRIGQHYRPADHSSYAMIRQDPHYRHLTGFFQRQGTGYQVLFHDMVLTREEWWDSREETADPQATAGRSRGSGD